MINTANTVKTNNMDWDGSSHTHPGAAICDAYDDGEMTNRDIHFLMDVLSDEDCGDCASYEDTTSCVTVTKPGYHKPYNNSPVKTFHEHDIMTSECIATKRQQNGDPSTSRLEVAMARPIRKSSPAAFVASFHPISPDHEDNSRLTPINTVKGKASDLYRMQHLRVPQELGNTSLHNQYNCRTRNVSDVHRASLLPRDCDCDCDVSVVNPVEVPSSQDRSYKHTSCKSKSKCDNPSKVHQSKLKHIHDTQITAYLSCSKWCRTAKNTTPSTPSPSDDDATHVRQSIQTAEESTSKINTYTKNKNRRFRPAQVESWTLRLQEAKAFRKNYGHCLIPHRYDPNPALARWAKRQRYQYKLFLRGVDPGKKASAMTQERADALDEIGFCWDAHEVMWEKRFQELQEYGAVHGHTNVPSSHRANPQLATWVKCQRRQYKLMKRGQSHNITQARIDRLNKLGFAWDVVTTKKRV